MRYLVLLLSLSVSSPLAADGLRTFTNQEGQTIQARMIRLEGDVAVIERDDRTMFRFPVASLSEADQVFVQRWPALNALSTGNQVEIRTRRSRVSRVVNNDPPDLPDVISFRGTTQKMAYQIVFNNRSMFDLKDLTVEYRIVKDLAPHAAPATSRPVVRFERVVKAGTLTLENAESMKETILETEPFYLVDTMREVWGVYDPALNRHRTVEVRHQDEIRGVWIRIMDGDKVIREDISPPGLARMISWE